MLIVDASCLFEVVADTPSAPPIRERLARDDDLVAPQLVDAEVLSAIRRQHRNGALDTTAATQAVEDLAVWPGERYGHRALLARAWELRDSVPTADALYVALAEALDAPLLTADARLARAHGPQCQIEVIAP